VSVERQEGGKGPRKGQGEKESKRGCSRSRKGGLQEDS